MVEVNVNGTMWLVTRDPPFLGLVSEKVTRNQRLVKQWPPRIRGWKDHSLNHLVLSNSFHYPNKICKKNTEILSSRWLKRTKNLKRRWICGHWMAQVLLRSPKEPLVQALAIEHSRSWESLCFSADADRKRPTAPNIPVPQPVFWAE